VAVTITTAYRTISRRRFADEDLSKVYPTKERTEAIWSRMAKKSKN
jgi:hypothetical protein